MNQRSVIIFTIFMFIFTILITLLFMFSFVLFIFKTQYTFPIVFFSILNILLFFYCIYYLNCIKYLKNKNSLKEKIIKHIKKQSQIGAVIQGFFSFAMVFVLISSSLYYHGFFKEQLFFFIPLIITICYTVNHIFLKRNIN